MRLVARGSGPERDISDGVVADGFVASLNPAAITNRAQHPEGTSNCSRRRCRGPKIVSAEVSVGADAPGGDPAQPGERRENAHQDGRVTTRCLTADSSASLEERKLLVGRGTNTEVDASERRSKRSLRDGEKRIAPARIVSNKRSPGTRTSAVWCALRDSEE